MEKRKVFKISIIDKEISRTEFDRNTFYTSDSELTLVFKLIEKDYTYDHGEILLYNENDESFVTRQVTKKDNDFVYELDLDIIPHYGTWKAQLQLVSDGDVYTSKPFDFSIVNDLSNLAPQPTLTDINNWATLKQSANELIDEMRDVIVDVERAESERVSNENYRKNSESERVSKENERKQAESKRVNQENKRQKDESERENNEKQRRIAEFERVDKETLRQQSETERVARDIIRENEIAQMKEDIVHYGGLKLTSSFENGDFSNGTTNWKTTVGHYNSFEVVDGVARNTEVVNVNQRSFIYLNSNIPSGHITYHAFRYKQSNVISSNISVLYGLLVASRQQIVTPTGDDFQVYTGMGVSTGDANMRLFISNIVAEGDYSIYLDYFIMLDLTDMFGEGNEPSKETLDWIISENGYFDELILNYNDVQQLEINQLRKAIIALGGTI